MLLTGQIRRFITAHARPSDNLRWIDPDKVILGAVQMQGQSASGLDEYIWKVTDLAVRAAGRGAQLIVFPENAAAPLLGTVSNLQSATVDNIASLAFELNLLRQAHLHIFRTIARTLRVYIYAGNKWGLDHNGSAGGGSYLFGPEGKILAGRRPGFEVTGTLLGKIGFGPAYDINDWLPFRILYLLGTEIAILPSASSIGNPCRSSWSLLSRTAESPMYVVQSCLVAENMPLSSAKGAGIFGPAALSPGKDGVWQQINDHQTEGVAVATVSLPSLHRYRRHLGIDQAFNLEIYDRYFPQMYGQLPDSPWRKSPHHRMIADH